MNQTMYKLRILQAIGHYIHNTFSEGYLYVIYLLYGIHKQYSVSLEDNTIRFTERNDILLNAIFNAFYYSINGEKETIHIKELYEVVSQVPYEEYEKVYIEIVNEYSIYIASKLGYLQESLPPKEITSLIAYFINENDCHSVFDPFCGTASIVHYLKDSDVSFVGYEFEKVTSLLARINNEARYGIDRGVFCRNSFDNWNSYPFDAVVSCSLLSTYQSDIVNIENTPQFYRNPEQLFFSSSFEINKAKLVIALESLSFCYSARYTNIRQFLVDNNYLDTIITLPEKLLYGTSIPCVLIICKSGRKEDMPVKFIDAELFFTGDDIQERTFSLNSFIETIKTNDETINAYANREQIVSFGYNLNPTLYNYEMIELDEGQELHFLGDLLIDADYERKDISPFSSYGLYPMDFLSTEPIQIWLSQSTPLEHNYDGRPIANRLYHCDGTTKYLLYVDGRSKPRLGLYSGSDDFVCHRGMRVAKVNEELATPEYLAYLIVNHPALKKGNLPLSECKMLPIAVDSPENQKAIVETIKQNYAERARAEQEADAKRLGVKQNISDMEHMLGTPKMKIDSIIEELEDYMPSQDGYQDVVKALKDNLDYMFRLIHFNNASIGTETLNVTPNNLQTFLDQYVKAWSNYGGNYFSLSLVNSLPSDVVLSFDKLLFTVMFDSILSNAVRHGFKKLKNYTPDNRVEISVSAELFDGKPYVVFRISNNGNPMNSNFTITDYITRGRYSADSGRSGLGGYHVYQIIKAHNGHLYLDSNKKWNMVVEVLIPYNNVESDIFIEYEHECI